MTWSYRIVKTKPNEQCRVPAIGLYEVYYNDKGEPWTRTQEPVDFNYDAEDGPETIINALEMALNDAKRFPVIDEETFVYSDCPYNTDLIDILDEDKEESDE
jgi:hypothetical protein